MITQKVIDVRNKTPENKTKTNTADNNDGGNLKSARVGKVVFLIGKLKKTLFFNSILILSHKISVSKCNKKLHIRNSMQENLLA